MNLAQLIVCVCFLALSAWMFCVSCLQFQEKGYLFNNAYFWASSEERRRMDEQKERKRSCYRQSGIAFLLLGIVCLLYAAYTATRRAWLFAASALVLLTAVIYAAASSAKLDRRE